MAGVKGRSGRRPLSVEKKRLAVIDKAWEIVAGTLNSLDVSRKEKLFVAEKIVSRDIGREMFMKGEGLGETKVIVVVHYDKKDTDTSPRIQRQSIQASATSA